MVGSLCQACTIRSLNSGGVSPSSTKLIIYKWISAMTINMPTLTDCVYFFTWYDRAQIIPDNCHSNSSWTAKARKRMHSLVPAADSYLSCCSLLEEIITI